MKKFSLKVSVRKMKYQGIPFPWNWEEFSVEAKAVWKSAID